MDGTGTGRGHPKAILAYGTTQGTLLRRGCRGHPKNGRRGTGWGRRRRMIAASAPSSPSPAISGARMPTAHPRHFGSSTGLLGAILVLASCAGDPPTGADEAPPSAAQASLSRLAVCHRSGSTGTIVEIPPADLAERLRQGD